MEQFTMMAVWYIPPLGNMKLHHYLLHEKEMGLWTCVSQEDEVKLRSYLEWLNDKAIIGLRSFAWDTDMTSILYKMEFGQLGDIVNYNNVTQSYQLYAEPHHLILRYEKIDVVS